MDGAVPAAVDPVLGQVTLRGGELPWRGVSPRLRTVRLILLAVALVPAVLAAAILAVLLTAWLWLAVGGLLVLGVWAAWLIGRQVSAISWIEIEEELVIRKGRLLRSLVSVPYGRMQFVDLASGPLLRAFDLAALELHTGSPESGGSIPGLPTQEAEALRSRLAARGESQRAGL